MRASSPEAAASVVSGPVLFARYAYGPNRLGLCGPDDAPALLAAGAAADADARDVDRTLRDLARGFEGAWPYLELIARANGIADTLDPRVVEAYWIGNRLLDRVGPRALGESLDERFRRRLNADAWRWLVRTPAAGARPGHAYHVLDVFPKLGLLRGGPSPGVLETMDECRIRWGTVRAVDGDWLTVDAPAIALIEGRLSLTSPRPTRVRAGLDGVGFVPAVVPGDLVSLHWDWACDRLTPGAAGRLERSTRQELAVANRSI
jgi:hypothetical protein